VTACAGGLKFYCRCFFSTRDPRDASADRREILHAGQYKAEFYNARPKFRGPTPKKFYRPKTCKIWPDFGRLRSSAANISKKDEDIQNRINILSTAFPSALSETSPVDFSPLIVEILMWNRTHPNRLFRKTIFRPLGDAAPPNFYTR